MYVAGINSITRHAEGAAVARPGAGTATDFSEHFARELEQSRSRAVQRGDTLSHIVAEQLRSFGREVSGATIYKAVEQIAIANGLQDANRISIGQKLDLSMLAPEVPKASTVVASVNSSATQRNKTPVVSLPVETVPVTPQVVSKAVETTLTPPQARVEFQPPPVLKDIGEILATPAPAPVVTVASTTPSEVRPQVENPWRHLLGAPARLTSEFGQRHNPIGSGVGSHQGIDLASQRGAPIFPLEAGRVVTSGWQSGYGNVVVVRHANGMETLYGHNSANLVSMGERVTTDTPLATVGSTGRSTAPHLHFEVRQDGVRVDPVPYIVDRPSGLSIAGAGGD